MSDLGTPDQLADEFAKNGRFKAWDILALVLTAGGLAAVYAFLIPASFQKPSVAHTPLLTAHIVAFATGILFAIFAGFCGVYVLARRDFSQQKNLRVETLFRRIIVAFCALVFVGSFGAFVTGLIFSKASGVSNAWYDYRHLGNTALILWSGISFVLMLRKKISTRWHFLSGIIGSLTVSDFLVLRAIVEGQLGPVFVVLGLVFYTIQLVPLFRHWSAEPQSPAIA